VSQPWIPSCARCGMLMRIAARINASLCVPMKAGCVYGTASGDSSGDFADFLAVFAAPKRIGLKSNRRLSGVLVRSYRLRHPTFQRI
jgi:hypothetical protein